MEKYSVLMSVYYKEKPDNLRASIDSMLKQTVTPDQFVLVKDGPLTSELDEVINAYVENNENLFTIVELEENSGLGIALDEGIKHCKNELIARMDSDDISLPNRCERELKLFADNPKLSIVSGYIGEFEDNPCNIASIRAVPERQEMIKKQMRTRSAFNHPAVMYKKTEVVRCGGYGKLKRKQDHDLFSRMMNNGCAAYNIQDIVLYFRAGKGNLKRRKSMENCKSYILVQWEMFKRHECKLADFLFVVIAQIFFFVAPARVVDYVTRTKLRKSVK